MIASFLSNLRMELTLRKSRISTYVYALLMFVMAFLFTMFAGGFFNDISVSVGGSAKAFINGPYKIHIALQVIGLIGLLIVGPIFGQTVCKDYEARIDQIVFATPTHRIGFYLGRFVGAIVLCFLIYGGFGLGHWMGSYVPGLQRSLFTTPALMFYVMPYLTSVLPNIVIFGSLFFALAAFTKRMGPVYVGGILLFLGYLFALNFTDRVDHRMLRALLDPFGLIASGIDTEYWSPFDQNTRLVTLRGYFLVNRLVWLGISLVMLVLGLAMIQKTRKARGPSESKASLDRPAGQQVWQTVPLTFTREARWNLLGRQLLFETRAAFKNIYFLCLTLAGVIFVMMNAKSVGAWFGTPTYPVTYNILNGSLGSFTFFMFSILIFYTGELVWRERQHRMNQIIDALPQPSWLPLVSKFLALQAVILVLLGVISLAGMGVQLLEGYTHFELGQVLRTQLLVAYPRFLVLSAFILFIHVLVDNKYIGHTVCAALLIAHIILPQIGLEHDMLVPGKLSSRIAYSDMNGYGPFLLRLHSYQLYWGLFGAGLLIVTYLFWPYGTDSALALRKKLARQRWNTGLMKAMVLISFAFVAQGGFIFYNTMVLNHFHTKNTLEKRQLAYEKTYKAAWDRKAQLQITAVNVRADITPETPSLKTEVDYILENKAHQPIDAIFLHIPIEPDTYSIEFDRASDLEKTDKDQYLRIYRFKEPVAPGALVNMKYKLDYQPLGFKEDNQETRLVRNGTFFNGGMFFPSIGYDPGQELNQDKTREKYGLKPKPSMNPITDEEARNFTYLGRSGNWIDFEATVSTTHDQIALAPGYLDKEWTDGDRHYFHYKMDRKILNFYSFQSAHYETKKANWNDVPITIYYQKGHEYNLDRMIKATEAGLDYYTKNFGPYQHHQFRILEFPRYESFAQAFPNTIPFSESIGFIAKVDDKDPNDFDYPFYVTAHELAHQWWAHQVIGGDVQGSTMLVETLAQYSAAMVVEKTYGREKVERLLRHELQDYLMGRSFENKREWPLALNENQNYIHYGKGILVMYALKEVVGEAALNAALKKFADSVRYQEPPFTTAPALVASLKADLDPKYEPLIDDLFNKVILFDNRIQSHKVTEEKDGSVTVDLEILGRKLNVDEKGEEKETDFAMDMEIAGRSADDKFLPGEHHAIKSGVNKIQLHFAKKPKAILLDPLSMWVDLNREDNKVNL